ncbi:non-ribosomal peptide synthetase [Fulvivirga sediminis]|uniref:Amino acid adenylation domain-containing protein n=1 Tax=Fulvivirga sediminis TaxID=2803949 RepID=A0A937FDG4_9BACT|nr:non-ribosomal peptide synthetase [Fulvivirga sediminis]MBL3658744.1 amino acid adenylation domain-containing protein [Fulvivirga sediminis]
MSVVELLLTLKKNNISLTIDEGNLKLGLPEEGVDEQLIQKIREHKADIIKYFGGLSKPSKVEQIEHVGERDYYPLTSAQKRLYFLFELEPNSLAYNQLQILQIEGDLDVSRLEHAFQKLINAHDLLKTTFKVIDGVPVQSLSEQRPFALEWFDGNNLDECVNEFLRPFNLKNELLIRGGLVKISSNTYWLLIDTHHIICDGISQGILVQGLMDANHHQQYHHSGLRYVDFAIYEQGDYWQNKIKAQERFWLSEFEEALMPLNLRTDYPKSVGRDRKGRVIKFSTNRSASLNRLAEEENATLYMSLLSVIKVLLYKLTGNKDIAVGTPVSGRNNEQLDQIVGMFVNTLVVRGNIDSDKSFRSLLKETRDKVLECFSNQQYPYESLVEKLNIERDQNRNPLFDVMFAYRNYNLPKMKMEGVSVSPLEVGNYGTAQFDLTITVTENVDELDWQMQYDASIYKSDTMERWVKYIRQICEVAFQDPDSALKDLNIQPEDEYRAISEVNSTAIDRSEESIIDLFVHQAQQSPDNIAVKFADHSLTYREVDQLSNQIANYLLTECNLSKGSRIGFLLERELWQIPLIYGIMKAGAVYIPLGVDQPANRISQIIEEGDIDLVISRATLEVALAEDCQLLDLDIAANEILKCAVERPASKFTGNDLAYTIYTSGSTGKPKGVMVDHGSLLNNMLWNQKDYPLFEADVLVQKTPLVFDVSLQELFWWSISGASLIIMPPGMERDPHLIADLVARENVTVIHFVPSMMEIFLNVLTSNDIAELKSLRLVIASGEALLPGLVENFNLSFEEIAGIRLINMYGPTEGTIHVTHYECLPGKNQDTIPIGKPIDNMRCHILDPDGNKVPIGVIGELYLEGAGLARGYYKQPQLTAQYFIADESGNSRIYKTGDLAYWREDGNIEYLGRVDQQVKVFGNRIELLEIENQIRRIEGVRRAAVIVYGEGADKRLVAYYEADNSITYQTMRDKLRTVLPAYMVPGQYIWMEALPQIASGKIDRLSLPAPVESTYEEIKLPKTTLENKIIKAWSQVLPLREDEIGVNFNFFQSGGTSLMLIKLSTILTESLGYRISVPMLFNHPTITSLVAYLQTQQQQSERDIEEVNEEVDEMHDILGTLED